MRTFRIIAGISALALAVASQAGLTLLTSRSQVNGTDSIDWGQFGATGTSVPDPSMGMTTMGSPFVVAGNGAASFTRLDQGNGFNGNFANGDHLLYTGFNSDGSYRLTPVSLSFGKTLTAVGAQIMSNYYGNFSATITAYDALGDNLGTVTENGTSNGNGDNSAIFIGVKSSGNNIAKITFQTVGQYDSNDFALNQVSLLPCAPVPEPSALAAFAIGGIGLFLRRRSR